MVGKSNMEEDSVLLKPRSDEVRKLSRQNSKEENLTIFKEYYLKKLIIGLVVFAFVLWSIIDAVVNRQDCVLSVMMIEVQCSNENQELFSKEAARVLQLEEKKEYVNLSPTLSPEVLVTRMAAGDIDILLMDRASFEDRSEAEYLRDLREVLDAEDYKRLESAGVIYEVRGIPVGISVADNEWFGQYQFISKDDIILGVIYNSGHLELCKELLHNSIK